MLQSLIRNFAIIAHIDHGKSTLADRLLELTGTVEKRNLREQTLDSHPVSRSRGITIRLAPVTMNYSLSETYVLNLIDTPGHVDFSYEVERSLAACEGALLVVDATQGVQAQTLSHLHKAQKLGLKIIPVINKMDLPNARVEEVEYELRELVTSHSSPMTNDQSLVTIYKISAKTGQGVAELLEAIVQHIPPPSGNPTSPTRALVFSSQFDSQRGVIAFVRIVDGIITSRDPIRLLANNFSGQAFEVGHFKPLMTPGEVLETGEVGYVLTNIKDPSLIKSGDTLTTVTNSQLPTPNLLVPLPGYCSPQPMVFVSFFPVDQNEFALLEDSLMKLKLNDAALTFSRTESKALGRGFRVGFLGHLHAEVTQERLEKDFNLSVIATTPTVEYRKSSETSHSSLVTNDPSRVTLFEEPWVKATIIAPSEYIGAIITLCENRRGKMLNLSYHGRNATLYYELPLTEIITDFFDQLKSQTSGFASLDYETLDYRPFDAVSLSILINHEEIDALSQMVEKTKAMSLGQKMVEKLKEAIPRQQIPIPIQAVINGQVIARADISAFRKDVTAKLYGGDRTRRMKLLEKQKKGKEKMKSLGQIIIPNDTFLKIFKT